MKKFHAIYIPENWLLSHYVTWKIFELPHYTIIQLHFIHHRLFYVFSFEGPPHPLSSHSAIAARHHRPSNAPAVTISNTGAFSWRAGCKQSKPSPLTSVHSSHNDDKRQSCIKKKSGSTSWKIDFERCVRDHSRGCWALGRVKTKVFIMKILLKVSPIYFFHVI